MLAEKIRKNATSHTVLKCQFARVNINWPTAVAAEADNVSSLSDSACHIGGPKGVRPGQKALLHGFYFRIIV